MTIQFNLAQLCLLGREYFVCRQQRKQTTSAFIIREALLRKTPLQRGGWLYFIIISIVLAVAAFWELLEWWVTLLVASDVGAAFLGSQGDTWDAQWDMTLALVGAMVALPILSRLHDRSMAQLSNAQSIT